jgi:hypothetical protein
MWPQVHYKQMALCDLSVGRTWAVYFTDSKLVSVGVTRVAIFCAARDQEAWRSSQEYGHVTTSRQGSSAP